MDTQAGHLLILFIKMNSNTPKCRTQIDILLHLCHMVRMPKAIRIDICRKCGTRAAFEQAPWIERAEVAGLKFEVEVQVGRCPNPDCGELRDLGHDEVCVVERSIAVELARRGRCLPEAFRYMRNSIEHRASSLGELLGVAADTISRWERGTVPLDRRAFAVLGQLVIDEHEGESGMHDLLISARLPPPAVTEPIRIALDLESAVI